MQLLVQKGVKWMSRIGKIRSSSWLVYFLWFWSQLSCSKWRGQLNGGDAWYRKTFRLDDKDLDKKVRLEFGGVYMDSKVYVNGQFVGHYPNGYNAFSYDITPYLNADGSENTIAVHVVNQQPSSRWYSGSGIYRDVKLSVTDKVHLAQYGTTITTPQLEKQQNGAVDTVVKSHIVNQDDQAHSIYAEYEIVDQNGQVVSEKHAVKHKLF